MAQKNSNNLATGGYYRRKGQRPDDTTIMNDLLYIRNERHETYLSQPDLPAQVKIRASLKRLTSSIKKTAYPYAIGSDNDSDLRIIQDILFSYDAASRLLAEANDGRKAEMNALFLEIEDSDPGLARRISKEYNFIPIRPASSSRAHAAELDTPPRQVMLKAQERLRQRLETHETVISDAPIHEPDTTPSGESELLSFDLLLQAFEVQSQNVARAKMDDMKSCSKNALASTPRTSTTPTVAPAAAITTRHGQRSRTHRGNGRNGDAKQSATSQTPLDSPNSYIHSAPAKKRRSDRIWAKTGGWSSRRKVKAILQDCKTYMYGVTVGGLDDRAGEYLKIFIEYWGYDQEDNDSNRPRGDIDQRLHDTACAGQFMQSIEMDGWHLPEEFASLAKELHLRNMLEMPEFTIPGIPDWVAEHRFPRGYARDCLPWQLFTRFRRDTHRRQAKERRVREARERAEMPKTSAVHIRKIRDYMEAAAASNKHNAGTGLLRLPVELRLDIYRHLGYSKEPGRFKIEIVPMQIKEPNEYAPDARSRGPGLTSWTYRRPNGHLNNNWRRVDEVQGHDDINAAWFGNNFVRRPLGHRSLLRRQAVKDARQEQARENRLGGHFKLPQSSGNVAVASNSIYKESDSVSARLIAHAGNIVHGAHCPPYLLRDPMHLSMVCRHMHEELTMVVFDMVDFSFRCPETLDSFITSLSPCARFGVTKLSLHVELEARDASSQQRWDKVCLRAAKSLPNLGRLDFWASLNDMGDYETVGEGITGPVTYVMDKPVHDGVVPKNLESSDLESASWWNAGLRWFEKCKGLSEVFLTIQPHHLYKGCSMVANTAQVGAIARLLRKPELVKRRVSPGWTWAYVPAKGLFLAGLEQPF